MTQSWLRREPSWSAPVAVPSNQLPGTDASSWLTTRPRTISIACVGVVAAVLLGFVAMDNPKFVLGIAAGIAVIVVVAIRPMFGALGLVALVPALSGIVPGIPVPNLRVSELLIGTIGVTLIVVARRSLAVKWRAVDWLLLGYGLLWTLDGIFGALTAHEHLTLASWGTVVGQLQFFLLYRSVKVTLRTTSERHLALRVLFVASGVVALLAVLEELHAPGIISLLITLTGSASAGGTGGILRATGPFANWASLAGYLLPLILVALCLGLGNTVKVHRKAQIGLALILTLAIFFTVELSVIICMLVGACYLGVRYGRGRVFMRWLGIGLLIIVVGAGSLLGHRLDEQFTVGAGTSRPALVPQTLAFRWSVWTEQYIPAFEKKPFTGYGVVLPSSIEWAFPESQYITFLIQGGIPLLAIFCFLLWAMLREAKRVRRSRDPVDRAMGEGVFVAVVSLGIVNFIWPYLSNAGMPQLLWCLFALLPPAIDRSQTRRSPQEQIASTL